MTSTLETTDPRETIPTQRPPLVLIGPFTCEQSTEGVDNTFEIFDEGTQKVVARVRYWHKAEWAEYTADTLISALRLLMLYREDDL